MRIQVYAEVEMPSLPNYLRYGNEGKLMMDIADVSDADLKVIGESWTKALLAHANERRLARLRAEPAHLTSRFPLVKSMGLEIKLARSADIRETPLIVPPDEQKRLDKQREKLEADPPPPCPRCRKTKDKANERP